MENLRKRTEREVADARLYGNASFARDVLAVADNMERAFEAVGPELRAQGDAKVKALVEGVELTERELLKVLEKHGVKKFSPEGEKFDPELPSGDVRGADIRTAGGPRRASNPGRLYARRSRAAPGDGRGCESRAEGCTGLRQRQSTARREINSLRHDVAFFRARTALRVREQRLKPNFFFGII